MVWGAGHRLQASSMAITIPGPQSSCLPPCINYMPCDCLPGDVFQHLVVFLPRRGHDQGPSWKCPGSICKSSEATYRYNSTLPHLCSCARRSRPSSRGNRRSAHSAGCRSPCPHTESRSHRAGGWASLWGHTHTQINRGHNSQSFARTRGRGEEARKLK